MINPVILDFLRRKWLTIVFVTFLVLAFTVRLYRIDTPLADWHSFRQADTASVTREYVKNGVDFLRPHYQDLSNIQSGQDNLEGYRMVEFPLVNGVLAYVLRAAPDWDLVVVSRLASVIATTLAITLLGWLVWRLESPKMGVLVVLVWAIMPYAIYYGRTILPEPFLLFFILAGLVTWYLWLKKTKGGDIWLILTGLLVAIALLVKPVAVFFAPAFLGMLWQFPERLLKLKKRQVIWSNVIKVMIVIGLSVIPLYWWRNWIQNFPTGIPVSAWLLNGNGIRLKPAWWRWIFADRVGRLMFGYWGAALLPLGLVFSFPTSIKRLKEKGLLSKIGEIIAIIVAWLSTSGTLLGMTIGMLAYLIVFASGNVQHDYYQILLFPLLVWLWSKGALALIENASGHFSKLLMAGSLTIIGLFSLAFSWYFVKDWFHINNWAIVKAGVAVDRLTPPNALVIAPYMGDTAFLFQTNRRGWPLGFDIEEKRELGAQFYVSTSKDDEVGELRVSYPVIEETDDYIIFDLRERL